MKVSLVVSLCNQAATLPQVLKGITMQTSRPDEILFADDGSTDDTRDRLAAFSAAWGGEGSRVAHLWQPNEGFRKNRILNQSVAAATGDYLVFMDGDCVPHRQFIADHRALAQPGFWVQGRRCYVREQHVPSFAPGTSIVLWSFLGRIAGSQKCVRLPIPLVFRNQKQRGILGCNMAFWRSDVIAVNGFDEAYQGRGIGADTDLATRVYNLGHHRKFVYGRALVYHLDHPVALRPHLAANRERLRQILDSRATRCEKGLNQHLKTAHVDAGGVIAR